MAAKTQAQAPAVQSDQEAQAPAQEAPAAPAAEPKNTTSVVKYSERGIDYNLTFLKVEQADGKPQYFIRSISGYLSRTSWVGHTYDIDPIDALKSPSDWRKCPSVRVKVARFIKATMAFFPAIDPSTAAAMVSTSLADEA
jgi:hypothetical protein